MLKIAVLPGDGIGPEVCREAVKVLEVVARKFDLELDFQQATVGGAAIDQYGVTIRDEDFATCEKCDAILFGAVGGPSGTTPKRRFAPSRHCSSCTTASSCTPTSGPVKVNPALIGASPIGGCLQR